MNLGQKIKVNFEFWIKFKVEIKDINRRREDLFVYAGPVSRVSPAETGPLRFSDSPSRQKSLSHPEVEWPDLLWRCLHCRNCPGRLWLWWCGAGDSERVRVVWPGRGGRREGGSWESSVRTSETGRRPSRMWSGLLSRSENSPDRFCSLSRPWGPGKNISIKKNISLLKLCRSRGSCESVRSVAAVLVSSHQDSSPEGGESVRSAPGNIERSATLQVRQAILP